VRLRQPSYISVLIFTETEAVTSNLLFVRWQILTQAWLFHLWSLPTLYCHKCECKPQSASGLNENWLNEDRPKGMWFLLGIHIVYHVDIDFIVVIGKCWNIKSNVKWYKNEICSSSNLSICLLLRLCFKMIWFFGFACITIILINWTEYWKWRLFDPKIINKKTLVYMNKEHF